MHTYFIHNSRTKMGDRPSAPALFAATCLVIFAVTPVLGSSSWTTCDDDNSVALLDVRHVSLMPDPPTKGTPFSMIIDAVVRSSSALDLRDTLLEASVYYHSVHVFTSRKPVCDALPDGCSSGPLQPGNRVHIESTQSLPWIAPLGPYRLRMSGTYNQGQTLMCVDVSFDVKAQQAAIETISAAEKPVTSV